MARKTTQTAARARRTRNSSASGLAWALSLAKQPGGKTPMLLALSAILMSALFFVQVFLSSAQGFDIIELQAQAEALQEENQHLEAHVGTLRSLTEVQKNAEELGMIETNSVVYLDSGSTEVALNR